MTRRQALGAVVGSLAVATSVLAWRLTGPRLIASATSASAPVSVAACQQVISSNLGYNEDARRCEQEMHMPWVRVSVRNTGHRLAPDFVCTLTAFTSYGQAVVDLPRPGGIPGAAISAGQGRTWMTYVPVPAYASVQSLRAQCTVISNPPI